MLFLASRDSSYVKQYLVQCLLHALPACFQSWGLQFSYIEKYILNNLEECLQVEHKPDYTQFDEAFDSGLSLTVWFRSLSDVKAVSILCWHEPSIVSSEQRCNPNHGDPQNEQTRRPVELFLKNRWHHQDDQYRFCCLLKHLMWSEN